jgi:hypothetical protein
MIMENEFPNSFLAASSFHKHGPETGGEEEKEVILHLIARFEDSSSTNAGGYEETQRSPLSQRLRSQST